MPKLSEKRRTAIYKAVFDVFMDVRVKLQREAFKAYYPQQVADKIDVEIAQAMDRAGQAAIRAAEGRTDSMTLRDTTQEGTHERD